MKLFIVTFLKEYLDDVIKIFKQAGISVFSAAEVVGFKDNQTPDMLESWFASGDEKFDSQTIFSFTLAQKAEHAMELIKKYNEVSQTKFPVRAFIVPVENSI